MSTYPPDWYTDRDQEHADFLARAEHADFLARAELDRGDPLLHWPEADRVLARERAEALRRVSEPVCMERIRPAAPSQPEDGLSAARGLTLGLIGGLLAWLVIVGVAWIAGAL